MLKEGPGGGVPPRGHQNHARGAHCREARHGLFDQPRRDTPAADAGVHVEVVDFPASVAQIAPVTVFEATEEVADDGLVALEAPHGDEQDDPVAIDLAPEKAFVAFLERLDAHEAQRVVRVVLAHQNGRELRHRLEITETRRPNRDRVARLLVATYGQVALTRGVETPP